MKKMLLGLCLIACVVVPVAAFARTQPAVLGRATFNTDLSCFTESVTVIKNTCTTSRSYSIPIIWDTGTPASKTIRLTATKNAGATLFCTYVGFTGTAIVANVNFPAFPTGVSTQPITVPSVPGGSFGEISCTVGANSTAGIVGVDYVAP